MAQPRTRTPAGRTTPATPLYRPMDHLVVRAPLLPVDAYLALGTGDGRGGALAPEVRRALAVASPSLLAALDRTGPGDPGWPRLEGKLLRYQIRMSTRPTPFGLFAGVGIARWADRTDLALAGPPRTRTRLDMEWLLRLVLRLEADPEVRRHLRLFANTAAFERAGRLHLSEAAPTGSGTAAGSVSVRATGAARQALAAAGADPLADLAATCWPWSRARPGAGRPADRQLCEGPCSSATSAAPDRPRPGRWVAPPRRIRGARAGRRRSGCRAGRRRRR